MTEDILAPRVAYKGGLPPNERRKKIPQNLFGAFAAVFFTLVFWSEGLLINECCKWVSCGKTPTVAYEWGGGAYCGRVAYKWGWVTPPQPTNQIDTPPL